jgi:hypothetical protein
MKEIILTDLKMYIYGKIDIRSMTIMLWHKAF